MPFWPWYMAACVGLILWNRAGARFAPVAILCGLVAMRGVVLLPDYARELAAFAPWLCVAMYLMYKGAWVPGAFCLLSGATYPTLLVAGLRIEYLGLVPIIADTFLVAAIFASGARMERYSNSGNDRARVGDNGLVVAQGMAAREGFRAKDFGRVAKIKAGQ
jgi:hypothetical protein